MHFDEVHFYSALQHKTNSLSSRTHSHKKMNVTVLLDALNIELSNKIRYNEIDSH